MKGEQSCPPYSSRDTWPPDTDTNTSEESLSSLPPRFSTTRSAITPSLPSLLLSEFTSNGSDSLYLKPSTKSNYRIQGHCERARCGGLAVGDRRPRSALSESSCSDPEQCSQIRPISFSFFSPCFLETCVHAKLLLAVSDSSQLHQL